MKSLIAGLAVVVGLGFVASVRADQPAPSHHAEGKIRVLLTYGGHAFQERQFFAMFDALAGVEYTKAPMPQSAGLFKPGLEKDYDVIVRYDMVPRITPDQEKALADLLRKGIGLVALHHNLNAQGNSGEYVKILGGRWCQPPVEIDGKRYGPSGWQHDNELRVTVADREHPITRGLADFTIHDEVYNHFYVAPDVHVLLTTDHPKNDSKIAWTHEFGKSRVFYLQLGHDSQTWKNPVYPEILARGIRWAAGK